MALIVTQRMTTRSAEDYKRQTGFSLYDQVLVDRSLRGTVAYIGETEFADGIWVGVYLRENSTGRNNGTVQGKCYFRCTLNRGLFVRPSRLSPVQAPAPRYVARPRESLPLPVPPAVRQPQRDDNVANVRPRVDDLDEGLQNLRLQNLFFDQARMRRLAEEGLLDRIVGDANAAPASPGLPVPPVVELPTPVPVDLDNTADFEPEVMTARVRVEQLEQELERILECSICLSYKGELVFCHGCRSMVACSRCARTMVTHAGIFLRKCPKCRHRWYAFDDNETNSLVRTLSSISQMIRQKPIIVDEDVPSATCD